MEKEHLTIVAKIVAKSSEKDLVKSELLKLVELTRSEKGNIQYDLHEDNLDQNIFLMYENWTNREVWQNHMETSHIEKFQIATEGAIEEFTVREMTQIE
ncbi:putative quinol monooxygenase [Croceiramulus getboli]|nr:putative quinol monooxygenase [Flavobacteriaceae bacterium YJPT1-3]